MKRMKRSLAKSRDTASDDMRPEYEFDYRKARPNRFAERVYKDRRVVILDPDISKVFPTSESVNTVLRAPDYHDAQAEERSSCVSHHQDSGTIRSPRRDLLQPLWIAYLLFLGSAT